MYRLAKRKFNIRANRDKQEILFGAEQGWLAPKPVKPPPAGEESRQRRHDLRLLSRSRNAYAVRVQPLRRCSLAYTGKAKLHSTYVVPYIGGSRTRVRMTSRLRSRQVAPGQDLRSLSSMVLNQDGCPRVDQPAERPVLQ
jgi:hypothetical protein